ncbi:MAG: 30S ribosomal protein S16 [Parcubacteria group bacterium GW2011_GWA1_47_9]|nr:MAG: 30S ribosomal protein S16 [Parcubacteria group bacterium GW2011_GWA1_47_9]
MLKVRLQRVGKRGQAYFRVVVVEHTKKPKGKILELLGSYNPHQKEFKANKERIEYWISCGAQISPTANNLLVNYKIWDRPKMQSWKPKRSNKKQEASDKPEETELKAQNSKPEEAPKEEAAEIKTEEAEVKTETAETVEAKEEIAPVPQNANNQD